MTKPLLLSVGLALSLGACAVYRTQPVPTDRVSAATLWASLESQKYRETWKLWPGTSALYPGKEPHGALLTTYVNDVAMAGIQGARGTMGAGALVVKENYAPDRTLAATTVMWKIRGYNPSGGDWFWAKYGSDGRSQAEGKVEGCLACHGRAAANDYLFSGSIQAVPSSAPGY